MEAVFREYDNELAINISAKNLPGITDAASLLWRLNCRGIDPGEKRWQRLSDVVSKAQSVNGVGSRSHW